MRSCLWHHIVQLAMSIDLPCLNNLMVQPIVTLQRNAKYFNCYLTIVCNLGMSIWQPDIALQTVTSRFGGDGGGAAGPSRPSRPSAPSRGGGGGRGGGRGGGGNQGSRPPMRGGYGGGSRGNSNGSNRGRGGMRNAPEPRVIANRMIQ